MRKIPDPPQGDQEVQPIDTLLDFQDILCGLPEPFKRYEHGVGIPKEWEGAEAE